MREDKAVRSDTRSLEADIRELERKGASLTPAQHKELEELRGELAKVRKLKEAFVALHPESKNLVLPERTKEEESSKDASEVKTGAPHMPALVPGRVPQRSVYYDPVFNPTGAPPPGMPYREKRKLNACVFEDASYTETLLLLFAAMNEWATSSQPPLPPGPPPPASFPLDATMSDAGDSDSDGDASGSDSDSGDEIMLPFGAPPPRPASEDGSSSDEDGIVMPVGPPPLPPGPSPAALYTGPPPGFAPPPPPPAAFAPPPVPYPGPPPRPSMYAGPPPSFAPPPPPPGFAPQPYSHGAAPHAFNARPPRGFYPPHGAPAMQHQADPLAPPGQTPAPYQSYHSRPRPPPNAPTGPSNSTPARPSSSTAAAKPASAVISAAPQLRDLAKEATTFVPPALRKKQAAERARAALGGLKGGVVPASRAPEDEEEEHRVRKPDLMVALQPHLGASGAAKGKRKEGDDYDRFLNDVGDLL